MKTEESASVRERVQHLIEHPGKYQVVLCVLLSVNSAIVAFNHTEPAFLNYTPPFHCKSNDSSPNLGCMSSYNESCDTYQFLEPERTIVTEFSLVCSRVYLKALSTTLYFCGVTIGALLFGPLADRYGRRFIMLICLYAQCLLGMSQYLADSFITFLILRSFQGAFVQGLQSSTFTLLLELFPSRHRTGVGVVWEIYWALGCAFMAVLAWFIMDWRWLQLALAVPTLITITYSWNIPESPIWLTTAGRNLSAQKICDKINKYNGNTNDVIGAPSHLLMDGKNTSTRNQTERISLPGMFRNALLRKHALVMTFVWFSVTLCYYVTIFYLPNLAGQRHVNFLIGALIEVLSYVLAFWILSRFGRRIPLVIYQMICGAICILVAVITHFSTAEHNWAGPLLIILVLLSKGCAVSCFCCMYLYTSELFPTSVRGAALGICGFCSRIGSLLSPQLLALGDYTHPAVPLICLGLVSICSGFTSIMVPETLGKPLPNTIQEAETLFNKNKNLEYDT